MDLWSRTLRNSYNPYQELLMDELNLKEEENIKDVKLENVNYILDNLSKN